MKGTGSAAAVGLISRRRSLVTLAIRWAFQRARMSAAFSRNRPSCQPVGVAA